MKFLRILAVAAAVLMTSAVARQAATVQPQPEVAPAPVTVLVAEKPAVAGEVATGQTKAGVCAACHGLDGNSANPQYPKIAGQHERYLWRQLQLFKSGERQNAIMQGIAATLTQQDMRDIGAFFATQKSVAGVADDTPITAGPYAGSKFFEVGERLFRAGKPGTDVPACMACHGPAGRGNPGPSYPLVGGQHAAYTTAQLQFFRSGGAWGKDARANLIMAEVARNLTDEDIQGLATYLEGLHHVSAPSTAEAR